MAVYAGEWSTFEDVRFALPPGVSERDLVYACYLQEDYSGNAVVVYRHDGRLWENTGSHCSCNGLEDMDGGAGATEASASALMGYSWPRLAEALVAWVCEEVASRAGHRFVASEASRAVVIRH